MMEDSSEADNLTLGRKAAIIGGFTLLFGVIALLFILPWYRNVRLGGEVVNTYDPMIMGHNALFVVTGPSGEQIGWESHTIDEINHSFLLEFITDSHYRSGSLLFGFDPNGPGFFNSYEPSRMQFKERGKRSIDLNGIERDWHSDIFIQTELGEHLYFDFEAATGAIGVFTPPVLSWPTSLQFGEPILGKSEVPFAQQSYSSSTEYAYFANYTVSGQEMGPCISRLFALEYDADDAGDRSRFLDQIFCEGIGLVEEQRFDTEGNFIEMLTLVSTNQSDLALNPIDTFPTVELPAARPKPVDIDSWEMTAFTNLIITDIASQPSLPLTLLPYETPLLVSARSTNGAIFTDSTTGLSTGGIRPSNSTYGTPAINPSNGLIYVGSSDKTLYVINQLGLFVDSYTTRGNIVTKPVFAGNDVWFSSEDGNIYCATANLDPAQVRTLDLEDPVVASPVIWNGNAIFGGDSGDLVAVDGECNELWRTSAGDPIDAPLTIDKNGIVFAAGHGAIMALNGETGEELWTSELTDSIHVQPTVHNDIVYVTDLFSQLIAYDRTDGRLLWVNAEQSYSGSPQMIGDNLLVNLQTDGVVLLDPSGNLLKTWRLSDAKAAIGVDLPISDLMFSPVVSRDAIWVIDGVGVIYQIAEGAE